MAVKKAAVRKVKVESKKAAAKSAAKSGARRSAAAPGKVDLPMHTFASAHELNLWLEMNHAKSAGIWMRIVKKGVAEPSVNYAEALDEALCYGWIDGQKGAIDATAWRQRFTPRGPRSIWSEINRKKAQALIEQGRMRPAGHAAIASAKEDGRWEAAYSGQKSAEVPDDLAAAIEANVKARRFFATLDRANRYAILFRVHHAKRPETRARKIAEFVAKLARGEKVHP
jgi:uncharacterized protein YdeI (YjbR/CyaY-like superfamily)